MQNPAANRRRVGIVRDHQRGLSQFAIRAHQHLQHSFRVLRIQVAGGLIRQNNRRPRDQRARDRNSLLFSTAQFRGPMLEPAPDRQEIAEVVEIP